MVPHALLSLSVMRSSGSMSPSQVGVTFLSKLSISLPSRASNPRMPGTIYSGLT